MSDYPLPDASAAVRVGSFGFWNATTGASFQPDEDGVAMLSAMGFTRAQCVKALQNTDNNVERAADWIFSHPDEINSVESVEPPAAPAAAAAPSPQAAPTDVNPSTGN